MHGPVSVEPLRAVAQRAREDYRQWRLRHLLATLVRQQESHAPAPTWLLDSLVRTWANPWSANEALLASMLRWLSKSSGAVLECGSGVSTLVLAAALSPTARRLVSLENDAVWARRVWDTLPVSLRAQLDIAVTPLVSYGDFDWYDLVSAPLPDSIGFVVCDGPPGSTRGGRHGLTRVLGDRLTPGAIVLLDDTYRPDERKTLEDWCAELPASLIEDATRHSVIQVAGGQ